MNQDKLQWLQNWKHVNRSNMEEENRKINIPFFRTKYFKDESKDQ
jgi:hypothetical protein